MKFSQKFFREIDLFDFTSFFGLDFFKFSGPLCINWRTTTRTSGTCLDFRNPIVRCFISDEPCHLSRHHTWANAVLAGFIYSCIYQVWTRIGQQSSTYKTQNKLHLHGTQTTSISMFNISKQKNPIQMYTIVWIPTTL